MYVYRFGALVALLGMMIFLGIPGGSFAEVRMITQKLSVGSSGDEVRILQDYLSSLGEVVYLDGKFGPQTKTAVQKIQARLGIGADGVVGPITAAAMFKAISGNYTQVQPFNVLAPTSHPAFVLSGPALKYGSRGPNVAELQAYLQNRQIYSGKIDGIFGMGTTESVKRLQAALNITSDGIVGHGTAAAINASSRPVTDVLPALVSPLPVTPPSLPSTQKPAREIPREEPVEQSPELQPVEPLNGDVRRADVTHFGANGQDSIDDTSAIQSAISSLAQGGVVYFPAGTYLISDFIETTAEGQEFLGASRSSVVLQQTREASLSGGIWVRHNNTKVGSMTIRRDIPTVDIRNIAVRIRSQEENPAELQNIIVRDMLLENFAYGIAANNPADSEFSDNIIKPRVVPLENLQVSDSRPSMGMLLTEARNVVIRNNTISPPGAYGVQHGFYINNRLSNVILENNTIQGHYYSNGIQARLDNQPTDTLVIRDNNITDATNSGILVYASSGQNTVHRNIKIENNKVTGVMGSTQMTGRGIAVSLYGLDGLSLSGNEISDTSGYGIYLGVASGGYLKNVTVASNVVKNWGQGWPRNAGLFLYTDQVVENVTWENNRFVYGAVMPPSIYTHYPNQDQRKNFIIRNNINPDDRNNYATQMSTPTVLWSGNSWNP